MNKIANKFGVLYKFVSFSYYNIILTGELMSGNTILEPLKLGHASCQSISYPLLSEAIKMVQFKPTDTVIDVGSGFGRLLLYLDYKVKVNKLIGFEINEIAVSESRKYCGNKSIDIFLGDILNFDVRADVYFLFNPFDADTLRVFLKHIQNSTPSTKVVFINAYQEHVDVFYSFPFASVKAVEVDKAWKGINKKTIVVAEV